MMYVTRIGQMKAALLLVLSCSCAAAGSLQIAIDVPETLGPAWHPAPGQRVPYGMIDMPDHVYGGTLQRACTCGSPLPKFDGISL